MVSDKQVDAALVAWFEGDEDWHLDMTHELKSRLIGDMRDALTAAEQAEPALEARLRAALVQIDALDPEGHAAGFSVDVLRGLVERMGAIARAALKEASDERA